MGLMDALRRAEEQGRNAARRGLEKAREGWEDTESRLRRKMRIFPRLRTQNKSSLAPAVSSSEMGADLHDTTSQAPLENERDTPTPRPIVSVNAHDVEKPATPAAEPADKGRAA